MDLYTVITGFRDAGVQEQLFNLPAGREMNWISGFLSENLIAGMLCEIVYSLGLVTCYVLSESGIYLLAACIQVLKGQVVLSSEIIS